MRKITIDAIKKYSANAADYMETGQEVQCDIQLAKAEAVKDIAIKLGLNA